MARPIIDFWFDFASTYSYVAAMRVGEVAEARGVSVRWRPFLLGPIFMTQGLKDSPFNLFQLKGKYMWRDIERCCAEINAPFVRPTQFPQSSVLAARVAIAGMEGGWSEEFCRAVFHAEFAQRLLISDQATIEGILTRMGINAAETLARAQSDAIKVKLRAETDEATKLEIFGAPTFITADCEMFWGNDRLEQALRWAARPSA